MSNKLSLSKLKPHFTVSFYTEYKKLVLEKFKYLDSFIEVFGFYEQDNSLLLKFEDFSFNLKNINFDTANTYSLSGLMLHCSTYESFNLLSSFDFNKININSSFLLVSFLDLKSYDFRFKFIFLDSINYKIEKLVSEEINLEYLENIKKKESTFGIKFQNEVVYVF